MASRAHKSTVGPTCHPFQRLSSSLFSSHFSSNFVSLGMGQFSLPRTPTLIKESWRTVWPSAKSSCLSRFIKSTTQGVSAGPVVIFHVINKDSFV